MAQAIRVDFVVDTIDWTPFAKRVPEGVTLVDLGARHIGQRPLRLARYRRRERPRAILSANDFSNEIAVLAAWWAGVGRRVVVTEHTTQSVELRSLPAWHPRRLLLPSLAKQAYLRADGIVTVSQGVARDIESLLGLAPGRATTIYNAVVTPDIIERSLEPLTPPWFTPGTVTQRCLDALGVVVGADGGRFHRSNQAGNRTVSNRVDCRPARV